MYGAFGILCVELWDQNLVGVLLVLSGVIFPCSGLWTSILTVAGHSCFPVFLVSVAKLFLLILAFFFAGKLILAFIS